MVGMGVIRCLLCLLLEVLKELNFTLLYLIPVFMEELMQQGGDSYSKIDGIGEGVGSRNGECVVCWVQTKK